MRFIGSPSRSEPLTAGQSQPVAPEEPSLTLRVGIGGLEYPSPGIRFGGGEALCVASRLTGGGWSGLVCFESGVVRDHPSLGTRASSALLGCGLMYWAAVVPDVFSGCGEACCVASRLTGVGWDWDWWQRCSWW